MDSEASGAVLGKRVRTQEDYPPADPNKRLVSERFTIERTYAVPDHNEQASVQQSIRAHNEEFTNPPQNDSAPTPSKHRHSKEEVAACTYMLHSLGMAPTP